MTVKLYRCDVTWLKIRNHHCWRVEKALKEQNIEYEAVLGPVNRSKRQRVEELTGQKYYPVIQFEDGSVYRDSSKRMEATIKAGKLDEQRHAADPAP
jgi:hypothetical protein